MTIEQRLGGEQYCYLTTSGRVTGRPHEIEIWFAAVGDTVYMCSGGRERSDWLRNLLAQPAIGLRIGEERFEARARVIEATEREDALARRLLFEKYQPGYENDLTEWRRTALPVAIEIVEAA